MDNKALETKKVIEYMRQPESMPAPGAALAPAEEEEDIDSKLSRLMQEIEAETDPKVIKKKTKELEQLQEESDFTEGQPSTPLTGGAAQVKKTPPITTGGL